MVQVVKGDDKFQDSTRLFTFKDVFYFFSSVLSRSIYLFSDVFFFLVTLRGTYAGRSALTRGKPIFLYLLFVVWVLGIA